MHVTKATAVSATCVVSLMYVRAWAGLRASEAGAITLRESKKINGEEKFKYNLAASFQNTINKILYKKTKVAVQMFREKTKKGNFQLIVAGGVAANETIRKNLSTLSSEMNFETVYPNLKFSSVPKIFTQI